MKKIIQLIVLAIGSVFSGVAQQTPAPPQSETVVIEGATAHLGNGEVIENSLIIFEGGKLTFVGPATTKISRNGTQIKGKGKHVYPGFIAPGTSLGLIEINAVRATDDQDELGEMIPHVRSLIAYNAESKVVESMRPNGVLLGQITPMGGRISGTSSIVQFDAWNWEDAAIKVNDGIHLNWPQSFSVGRPWRGEEEGAKPNKDYLKEVEKIISFMHNGKNYLISTKSPKNLPYEALEGLFNGLENLYVHANGVK